MRTCEGAAVWVRFGYPRIHVLLQREGWRVNRKRVYRLYRLEAQAGDDQTGAGPFEAVANGVRPWRRWRDRSRRNAADNSVCDRSTAGER